MNRGEWIVCERTSRWAAGIRTTVARHATNGQFTTRVFEVRKLSELAARLGEKPASLALVEVHEGNLANVLAWLTEAQHTYPHARSIALFDNLPPAHDDSWPVAHAGKRDDVVSALLEAGAVDVADSPRHLHSFLAIAERHRALVATNKAAYAENLPLLEWARSLLPWQDR
jgi:hypothetical protein